MDAGTPTPASTPAPGGKEAVRAWLQQRRGVQSPPPAPADLRHLFDGAAQRSKQESSATGTQAKAALAIARRSGLSSITMARLAEEMHASRTATYLQVRSVAAAQLLAADWYEREYHAAVVWRAHEDPPGMPRLRRMFEGAARWIAADGAFSPYADPSATVYHRLPDKVVAALELGRSRWRSALLGELRAAQARGELAADSDCLVLLNALAALLHDIRRGRQGADADALAERACGGMEGLLARHSRAPARPARTVFTTGAPGTTVRRLRPAPCAVHFHWPDWLMAGAPYNAVEGQAR